MDDEEHMLKLNQQRLERLCCLDSINKDFEGSKPGNMLYISISVVRLWKLHCKILRPQYMVVGQVLAHPVTGKYYLHNLSIALPSFYEG